MTHAYGSRRDELDAELLELAIQVRALQPDAVGDLAHVGALARDVILEVQALERVARLAQLQVERQRRTARPPTGASSSDKRTVDIDDADLGVRREQGQWICTTLSSWVRLPGQS